MYESLVSLMYDLYIQFLKIPDCVVEDCTNSVTVIFIVSVDGEREKKKTYP